MGEPATSGKVLIKIATIGDVLVELWPKECPKACRNFIQLSLEGYYDGCIFHRLVPNFLCQTGDPTGTGRGGESIYDEGPFEDEISQRIRFNRRGILGMANQGKKNTNDSQFFFTLDRADTLNGKYTAFGTITGDTIYNLLKFNELQIDPKSDEKPLYPPTIRSIEILDNPFDDIQPRITAAERKEQQAARKQMRAQDKLAARRGKGVKNAGLLSFEADAVEEVKTAKTKGGMKSAHDLLHDARLSKEVKDDRGFSAELPASFLNMPIAANAAKERKRQKLEVDDDNAFRPKKLEKKVAAPVVVESEADKRKKEIADLQSQLLGMRNKKDDDDSDDDREATAKATKDKNGLSGAALLASQRAQFLDSGKASRGKKRAAEPTIHPDRATKVSRRETEEDQAVAQSMDEFKAGLRVARKSAAEQEVANPKQSVLDDRELGYAGEILEEDAEEEDENDMSFLTHKLKFRKDVTADRQAYNNLVTIDPREAFGDAGMTLEDAKRSEETRRRKGQVPTASSTRDNREGGGNRQDRQDRDWRGQTGADRRRD